METRFRISQGGSDTHILAKLSRRGLLLFSRGGARFRVGFSQVRGGDSCDSPAEPLAPLAGNAPHGEPAAGRGRRVRLFRAACGPARCRLEADVRLRFAVRHALCGQHFALGARPLDLELSRVLAGIQVQGTGGDAASWCWCVTSCGSAAAAGCGWRRFWRHRCRSRYRRCCSIRSRPAITLSTSRSIPLPPRLPSMPGRCF